MTDLCRIAAKYGTDKLGDYSAFYDLLFRDRRHQVNRVLEIGIGSPGVMTHVPGYQAGASLRMWRDYFPHAQIFGVDNNTSVLFQEDRIKTTECDQGKPNDLLQIGQWTGGGLDLIVDDGDHDQDSQIISARMLFPYMTPGGLYIIEDVRPLCVGAVSEGISKIGPHALVTFSYSVGREDRLILIRKPE